MQLFHVSDRPIDPGQALRRYGLATDKSDVLAPAFRMLDGDSLARSMLLTRTGRLRRRFRSDPDMQLVLIEALFERTRVQVAPDLPSRLTSVFLWPTVELARDFRERYRPRGLIHRCLLTEGLALSRDASLVAARVDLAAVIDDEIQTIERRAVRYWTTDGAIDYPEILVQGTVVVAAILAPNT